MKKRSIPMYEVSAEMGLTRSNGRKYALRKGFTFHRRVSPTSKGQEVLCLYEDEAEALKKIRSDSLI